MTASEFAFLALGLVLGVASGAALIEVLRARPPAAREVRVTVAPNAIHSRMAATLSDPHGITDQSGPARGGPADRRWRDEVVETGEPATTGRRSGGRRADPAGAGSMIQSGTPVRQDGTPDGPPEAHHASLAARPELPARAEAPARPNPFRLSPASPTGANLVAVPMSMEPDPITTALRATAAASAVAAMARADPHPRPQAMPMTAPRSNRSAVAAVPDRLRSTVDAGPDPASPTGSAADGGQSAVTGGGSTSRAANSAEPGALAAAETGAAVAAGPCAEERRVADERCAVASRSREGAAAAAETLRRAQRSYDELSGRAEAAAGRADPRSVRAAKEQAQQRFREARRHAKTRDDVEAGARTWLAEINRINGDTREASLGVERDRAAAAAMASSLERLAVEADAARISAARADEACMAAREAVVACDEAIALETAAARARTAVTDPEDDATGEAEAALVAGAGASGIAPATPDPEEEFDFSTPMRSQAAADATIIRILRGDREAMQRAVARLAGDDPEARRVWQAQLSGLVEALIARSIEATAFEFPLEHPFWGPFSQSQNRDITAGLASLGFRFDGFGGWVEEHQPGQRDLSLAVGYAGLDPMRVRRWPTEAETRELLRDIRVAADEYVAGAAGGLTLGEMVTMLGLRADGLAELWNQWGSVRPILLEAG